MSGQKPPSGLSDNLLGFFEEEQTGFTPEKTQPKTDDHRPSGVKTEGDVVAVMVPLPTDGPYSYLVGEGMRVEAGSIVKVPLGPRTVIGVVWDDERSETVDPKKLRSIVEVYDVPSISHDIRRFVDWVARYTLSSPGLVARMVVRLPKALSEDKPIMGVRIKGEKPSRMTPAREKVLALADGGQAWSKSNLATAAGVTSSVVDGLVKVGALETIILPPEPVADKLDPDFSTVELFESQKEAGATLRQAVAADKYSVTLIDGVTGSGKTEVYFEAISEALKAGKQILILVPEISLTSAFLDRFAARFGGLPTEWHSDITSKRRELVWRGVSEGEVRVVVGARSALFLPFQDLGLIIVDEEHDMAYKQEDRAIYNARDMAVVRGHLNDFAVVLASATPSLESYVNAEEGRYQKVVLKGRFSHAELPSLSALDMRINPPEKGRWLAPKLVAAIRQTIEDGKQALLFLNRRGYAPLTLCRQCGFRFQCPECATWLVEHRFRNTIECHHCGHTSRKPDKCPNCDGVDTLVACGPGVERIHEEVLELFPDARSIILSSDMFTSAKRLKQELAAIERGEADIIIGTQLVAKGHNFPLLSLVGVVDADLGLGNGDMRAAERTFQLLSQVTGRAGRAGGKSCALLQSYAPDHVVMKAILAGDRDAFYKTESEQRKNNGLPPYGRLVSFIISGNDKTSAMQYGQHLRMSAPQDARILILGPSEAPLAVVRGRYRARLLIQAPKNIDIQSYIKGWLAGCQNPRNGVHLQIDVDPQSFW